MLPSYFTYNELVTVMWPWCYRLWPSKCIMVSLFTFPFYKAVFFHNVKYLCISRVFLIITPKRTESQKGNFVAPLTSLCILLISLSLVHRSISFGMRGIPICGRIGLIWWNVKSDNGFHNILRKFDYDTNFPPPPKSMLRRYVYTTGACLYFSVHAVHILNSF